MASVPNLIPQGDFAGVIVLPKEQQMDELLRRLDNLVAVLHRQQELNGEKIDEKADK